MAPLPEPFESRSSPLKRALTNSSPNLSQSKRPRQDVENIATLSSDRPPTMRPRHNVENNALLAIADKIERINDSHTKEMALLKAEVEKLKRERRSEASSPDTTAAGTGPTPALQDRAASEDARSLGFKAELDEGRLYSSPPPVARRSIRSHVSNTTRSVSDDVTVQEVPEDEEGEVRPPPMRRPLQLRNTEAPMGEPHVGESHSGATRDPQADQTPKAIDGMPKLVKNFPPIHQSLRLPNEPEEFSVTFLRSVLKGTVVTPGVWCNRADSALAPFYYTSNRKNEPYLPGGPGHHGAKLTVLMQGCDLEENQAIPLFIRAGEERSEYVYYGDYTEPRLSDELDWERQEDVVPAHVRQHWATELTNPQQAKWRIDTLVQHFYPDPVKDIEAFEDMEKEDLAALEKHWRELEEKVRGMRPKDILEAFERPSKEEPPGLRFCWEYLKCVGYNHGFYDALVNEKKRVTRG